MITLLVLSLILHIFTFYWLFLLMQRINTMKALSSETAQKEMEESLTAYIMTMQEENDRFLKEIATRLTDKEASPHSHFAEVTTVNKNNHEDQAVEKNQSQDDSLALLVETENSKEKEKLELSLSARAISLANKGLNTTEIAKKLDRGKGEIELLLKFNDKR